MVIISPRETLARLRGVSKRYPHLRHRRPGGLLVLLLAEMPSIRFVRRLDLPAVVREMSA